MIVMTLAALGPVVLIERQLVFAAVKETGIGRMAKTATPAHLGDARRAGGVIAVAGVTRRCTEITAHEQCASVHTVAIFGELRGREWRPIRARKSSHDFRIRVARATRFRNPLCVHFRLGIFRRTNAVNTVTTHARWRAIVVFFEQGASMRTILELRQLIGRQRRIELVHLCRIGMASRTEFDNPCPIFLAIFLRPFLDEIVAKIGRRIAAVTTGAREAAPKMDVLHDFLEIHVRDRLA